MHGRIEDTLNIVSILILPQPDHLGAMHGRIQNICIKIVPLLILPQPDHLGATHGRIEDTLNIVSILILPQPDHPGATHGRIKIYLKYYLYFNPTPVKFLKRSAKVS
jgi:hypothetical protein